MQKTKLGISSVLFGASLYFMGLISTLALVVMAGYVLLFEENEWLKKNAIKAVGIVIFFTILSSIISLVSDSSSFLSDIVSLFRGTLSMLWLRKIISICMTVISFVETLCLLMFGFKTLKGGTLKFSYVDKVIDENM